MELSLSGSDWQLIHLMPSEAFWRKVWQEDWDPLTSTPPAGSWLTGTVPGDVIADALYAGLIPDPYTDLNSRACEWLSERDWVYRKSFFVPAGWSDKRVRLRFDGVDYAGIVWLNGEKLGEHEGMFTPFEFDVTPHLRHDRPNVLVVLVRHMPSVDQVQGQIGRTADARLWKARFAYDWDWCTRLVPVGIWQDVRLIATQAAWIDDVWVSPKVFDEPVQLEVCARIRSHQNLSEPWHVAVEVTEPGGDVVGTDRAVVPAIADSAEAIVRLPIAQPQWWYPNGLGGQPLYTVRVDLSDDAGSISDTREVHCGLRRIRAIPNQGAPADALPYTLEVNGRKMFVKGWNWVPIDHMYGRVQRHRHERWLGLVQHAHGNLLRVWGGGLLERSEFYDLCDRLGILVWQEFPLSSSGPQNAPPTDAAYLDAIESQARQMVPLRRNHPSLAIWCGGNELMDDDGTPLTDNHPALSRLKSVVQELDPDRLWLPTSASGPVSWANAELAGTGKLHDIHGQWLYQGPVDHYRLYNTIDALYHSEFGVEGATNRHTLERFISLPHRFPPTADNPVWLHHGSWWLNLHKLEPLFGELPDVDTFIRASQWLQAEGLRYIIEADRRRKWRCSGVSPWQFNEAFPNASCTNALDYLGQPKPAYWCVRRAYESVHLSLKYDRLTWKPAEPWSAELWLHNSAEELRNCKWTATVVDLSGNILAGWNGPLTAPENENSAARIAELTLTLPTIPHVALVFLELTDEAGRCLSRNEYVLPATDPPLQPMLKAPRTELQVRSRPGHLSIRNTGTVPALFVQVFPADGRWILSEDDYFCLGPREGRGIKVSGEGEVVVRAWNSGSYRVRL